MKKLILIGAIVVVSLIAIIIIRGRFAMGISTRGSQQNAGADLVIVNDSPDTISVEYRAGDKGESPIVKPGDSISGGQGFIRIFTVKKSGSYEIKYEYPRPAGAPAEITLSEITSSLKRDKMDNEIFVKRGTIDDITIDYEELEQFQVTY